MGVREYWYETFRRVLVIPTSDNCYFLSIDVYKETRALATKQIHRLSVDTTDTPLAIIYAEYPSPPILQESKPEIAELVAIRIGQGDNTMYQIVNVRLMYCGIKNYPSYEEIGELYNEVIRVVEDRDPRESQLEPPLPIKEAYKARLKYVEYEEE